LQRTISDNDHTIPDRPGTRVALSFANPELLALLPALALLWWWRSRRTSAAVRFPSVESFAGLPLSRRPVIVGEGLRLLALLAVVVGLAGPRTPDEKTRLTVHGITILFVLDTSGSMEDAFAWQDGPTPISRREAAKRAFRLFVAGGEGPDGTHFDGRSTNRGTDAVGLITFSTLPQTVSPPTLNHSVMLDILGKTPAAGALDTATNIGDALAEGVVRLGHAGTREKVLILLSDGEHNYDLADPERAPLKPRQAARLAAARDIKIYVIDTGGDPKPGPDGDARRAGRDVNQQIAEITGGQAFQADDGAQLREVCRQIDRLERLPVLSPVYRRYHEYAAWLTGLGVMCAVTVFVLERTVWRRLV